MTIKDWEQKFAADYAAHVLIEGFPPVRLYAGTFDDFKQLCHDMRNAGVITGDLRFYIVSERHTRYTLLGISLWPEYKDVTIFWEAHHTSVGDANEQSF
jgi:uncharacterized protein YbdZ (MbtH family)